MLAGRVVVESFGCRAVRAHTCVLTGATFVNADATSTYAELAVEWDPVEAGAEEWLGQMRSALDAFGREYDIVVSMSGHPADGIDTFRAVYNTFPTIVLCTGIAASAVSAFARTSARRYGRVGIHWDRFQECADPVAFGVYDRADRVVCVWSR